MELDDLNILLYTTIDAISEIGTSRVSMWSPADRYAHVPFFRFKFKDHDSKGDLYEKLARVISDFKGNFVWTMDRHPSERSSYIIAPSIYIKQLLQDKSFYSKEDFMNKMPYEEYRQMVDRTIQDIPLLAEYISELFGSASIIELAREELISSYQYFYHITSPDNAAIIEREGIIPQKADPLNLEGVPIVCLTIKKFIDPLKDQLGPAVFRISAEVVAQKQFGFDETFQGWEQAKQLGEVEGLRRMIERNGTLAVFDSFNPKEIIRIE